jgi:hypothetical protein
VSGTRSEAPDRRGLEPEMRIRPELPEPGQRELRRLDELPEPDLQSSRLRGAGPRPGPNGPRSV